SSRRSDRADPRSRAHASQREATRGEAVTDRWPPPLVVPWLPHGRRCASPSSRSRAMGSTARGEAAHLLPHQPSGRRPARPPEDPGAPYDAQRAVPRSVRERVVGRELAGVALAAAVPVGAAVDRVAPGSLVETDVDALDAPEAGRVVLRGLPGRILVVSVDVLLGL